MPPWKVSSEAMLTIAPPAPRAKAARAKAWQRKNTAFRFTSITSSQSASVKSTASARRMIPALLTRMSSGPTVSSVCAAAAGSSSASWNGRPLSPSAAIRSRVWSSERPPGGDHLGPGAGEAERDRLADAGVGAGDERDLAVETEGVAHRRSPIATISTSL